mmetsp:Transcript_8232/g.14602  ORF Transcript_8232/g.14602 Transcript_8232/m.14602 type:complete len:840 (-) Transcript_8232:71-2590(-)|eukprot:CAMPEP_0197657854 /NCGR_PEP_ID=MMETSP1338-20131121/44882_1 /TAXON_ID=43686 ORGANISM="Pelagodinium beii, Strain RCC1491" /NCGR_SAMPLE_ID=MMETSP1338 /ASSEMBLY_ACC=CAM_ASM_000754 /LENGTH=839 /DNA_ID=CAMNT_0043234317 /DNA_START=47 /DNA_END=2566 /DNA_ORIENTATION=+
MAQEHSRVRQGRSDEEQPYEVVRKIGSGSFAQVFLVFHKNLGRQCVMKEVTSFTAMSTEKQEAAEVEVQLLSALHHPNIVSYLDSVIDKDGHLCILMEYCEHGDVHTYLQGIKRAGQALPSETQVLEWFVQIVLALQVLHAKRILHRDLKTQNIFLSGCGTTSDPPDFVLKLGDLGVAKVLSSTAELAMTQIGTPFYMSPELFNNKPYGYKSDIWGLGCVLYELVNGHNAFEAQSINGLALKIMKARYTPITSSCSEDLQNLIRSMLSTNPAHRPSLQEMLHVSIVRRNVPAAIQAAVSAADASGLPDAKATAETALAEQLSSLGLGNISEKTLNLQGSLLDHGLTQRRDKRELQQRLERAERRKKKEEETLRRLQETAATLGQYLNPRSGGGSQAVGPLPPNAPNASGYGPHGLALPLRAPLLSPGPLEAQDADGPLSHRDKVLLRKERRREEEQQRFEEEARKIREENLAYQRAWVMGSKDMASSSRHHSKDVPQQLASSKQLPSQLTPLLENKHITPANLANPFQSCRQKVLHTPFQGERHNSWGEVGGQASPRPPPPAVQYNEPAPPQEGGKRVTYRWGEEPQRFRRARSLRGVSLEALPSEPRLAPEHSEESDFSGSYSDTSDPGREEGDARLRMESQVVQQRIEECRAAIYRHKMTIDMLQNAFMQESEAAPLQLGLTAGNVPWLSEEGQPSVRTAANTARRTSAVPAFIQDRVARLRRRCMEGLGVERFEAARQCMQFLASAEEKPVQEEARDRMLEVLGRELIGFYALVDQMVHMELQWGTLEPEPPPFRPQGGLGVRGDDSLYSGSRWPSAMSDVYSTAKSRMETDYDWF